MSENQVSFFKVNQKTPIELSNIYNNTMLLILVTSGVKVIKYEDGTYQAVEKGQVLVISPKKFITVNNQPEKNGAYQAICLSYSNINQWTKYLQKQHRRVAPQYQVIQSVSGSLVNLFHSLEQYQDLSTIPQEVKCHRFIEPIIWLNLLGINFNFQTEDTIYNDVRDLILSNLSFRWKITQVALYFGYSEAKLRRKLLLFNTTFSRLLINIRLETSLFLLQTTKQSLTEISLNCGFSTPSHFSSAFKCRFKITPKEIRKN